VQRPDRLLTTARGLLAPPVRALSSRALESPFPFPARAIGLVLGGLAVPEDGWLASWLLQPPSRNSCAHVDRTVPLIESSTGEDFMRRFLSLSLSLSLSVHRGVGGVSDS
jgi:hypothetical protein